MANFIQKEIKAFDTFDENRKRLIVTNIVYSMVFPFIVIFSTAFVNRATGDQVMAIINGFGFSVGLILGNYTNGILLRKNIGIRYIYSTAMLMSILATFLMMLAGALIIIFGGTVLSFTIHNQNIIFSVMKISFMGVIIMKASQLIAEPLIIMSYSVTKLSNMKEVTKIEKRDSYTYVFDNEITMNLGKTIGGMLFIAINFWISPLGALQLIFIILGSLQIITSILVNKLTALRVKSNPVKE